MSILSLNTQNDYYSYLQLSTVFKSVAVYDLQYTSFKYT